LPDDRIITLDFCYLSYEKANLTTFLKKGNSRKAVNCNKLAIYQSKFSLIEEKERRLKKIM